MVFRLTLPARSVAVAVTVTAPTPALVPPETVTTQEPSGTPAPPGSVAAQCRAGTAPNVYVAPSAGPWIATDGGVLSIFRCCSLPVEQLPRLSHTWADVAVMSSPSAETTVSGGGGIAVAWSSVTVQRTVTLPSYQPLSLGCVTTRPETSGNTSSTLAPPPGCRTRPFTTPSTSPVPPSVRVSSTDLGLIFTRFAGSWLHVPFAGL